MVSKRWSSDRTNSTWGGRFAFSAAAARGGPPIPRIPIRARATSRGRTTVAFPHLMASSPAWGVPGRRTASRTPRGGPGGRGDRSGYAPAVFPGNTGASVLGGQLRVVRGPLQILVDRVERAEAVQPTLDFHRRVRVKLPRVVCVLHALLQS